MRECESERVEEALYHCTQKHVEHNERERERGGRERERERESEREGELPWMRLL